MSFYDFSAVSIDGEKIGMDQYKGKIVLVVNTASKCGFTPQLEDLQKLYSEYNEKGFEILGFPCNQFMEQEPGSNQEIKSFCSLNYGVSFPIFKKLMLMVTQLIHYINILQKMLHLKDLI